MGSTLFDQLKKSGLIDEKRAKQVKKEKHKQTRKQKGKKGKAVDTSKQRARQAQAAKTARDRKLNQQRRQAVQQKADKAQIKQLIQKNCIKESAGKVGFNFVDERKVQRLHITEQLQEQLSLGRLAIIKWENGYELVPVEIAEKIKLRDPSCVLFCTAARPDDKDEDDPYAEYQVPDDLMW